MEQIKVNMTPCGFTPTIHASQDDNSTRKWGFELYDENGKIDSSSIKEQMIFDSRVGGTEQILPENTSNPTTSPIIADIQYPDSLRSEQTFLYRESPTTEDGQAKIKRIQGNTVVFNQLVQNGNFADGTNGWTYLDGLSSISASNNICTVTFNSANQYNKQIEQNSIQFVSGHSYLMFAAVKSNVSGYQTARFRYAGIASGWMDCASETTISVKFDCTTSGNGFAVGFANGFYSGTGTVKNAMIIDLTQLNNSAITDAPSFRSYYNLSYYDYTTGKLVPFLGEELKTIGKNLYIGSPSFDGYTDRNQWSLSSETYNGHEVITKVSAWAGTYKKIYLNVGTYTFSVMAKCSSGATCYIFPTNWESTASLNVTQKGITVGTEWAKYSFTFEVLSAGYVCLRVEKGSGTTTLSISEYQLEFGSSASSYESYTENTISLPTLTHFPTGIKRAGNVFDELTENKATTKLGGYVCTGTDGSSWSLSTHYGAYTRFDNSSVIAKAGTKNFVSNSFDNKLEGGEEQEGILFHGINGRMVLHIQTSKLSTDDVTGLMNYFSAHPFEIFYELATSIEIDITTASLVTEKGEAPLYYDDELIADCNETISSESGIFDAKIKLVDDNTIYSQKIQLHIERKP